MALPTQVSMVPLMVAHLMGRPMAHTATLSMGRRDGIPVIQELHTIPTCAGRGGVWDAPTWGSEHPQAPRLLAQLAVVASMGQLPLLPITRVFIMDTHLILR